MCKCISMILSGFGIVFLTLLDGIPQNPYGLLGEGGALCPVFRGRPGQHDGAGGARLAKFQVLAVNNGY